MCSCLGLDYGVHAGLQLKHGFRMRSLECVTRVTGDWGVGLTVVTDLSQNLP